MSGIGSRDTGAEVLLRKALFALGLRFRLHVRKLPGSPDIVLPKYKSVIFVHGCFWHRHENCRRTTTPKKNVELWQAKFAQNVERDRRTRMLLEHLGWKVITTWECEVLNDPDAVAEQLTKLLTKFLAEAKGSGAGDDHRVRNRLRRP